MTASRLQAVGQMMMDYYFQPAAVGQKRPIATQKNPPKRVPDVD
jgi:hypothetical protein